MLVSSANSKQRETNLTDSIQLVCGECSYAGLRVEAFAQPVEFYTSLRMWPKHYSDDLGLRHHEPPVGSGATALDLW